MKGYRAIYFTKNTGFQLVLFSFLLLCLVSCRQSNENPSPPWEDFVIFREGNYPLIIVAPHGGDLKPQWIEDRDCANSVITQDQYTLGIALQLEEKLKTLGIEPFMVLTKIHRIKVDLNRSLTTSHCEDDTSNELWRLFHRQIEDYSSRVANEFGQGLLIDLHGHGHSVQRIELGYLLSGQQLRDFSQSGNPAQSIQTSIDGLLANHPRNQPLDSLIFGTESLGTLLSNSGFPATPSQQDPAPLEGQPFFSGGSNTKNYGSSEGGQIDAVQIEMNRKGLRQTSQDRERFTQAFAEILAQYMRYHYADVTSSL